MPERASEPLFYTVRYDPEHRQLIVGRRPVPVVTATIENTPAPVDFRTRRVIVGFENRWQLSVVWGGATYSDNHDWVGPMEGWHDTETQPFTETPHTVEVGVLLPEPITLWGDPLAYVGTNHLLALLDVMPRLPSHPDPALLVDPDFDDVVGFIATAVERFGLEL